MLRIATMVALALGAMRVGGAAAQPATQPMPPEMQACQQVVLKLTGEGLDWQAQAIALKRQVDALNAQIAGAKPPTPETPKP